MPRPYIEVVPSVPTGASSVGLASIPVGADSALVRVEGATCRWSETGGSYLTASSGIPVVPGESIGVTNLDRFRVTGLAAGGVIQAAYYTGLRL